ncbi:hypothetical protein [Streptomyces sp. NPDC057702]|uniref:hypothetical protein n=1 Tax=unclassified Streptomyces TaxID=2593676 RepID=UPI0036C900B7
MRNTPESEAKQKTGRLELSVAQVAGSALAAVAAAVLASRLGVYGTIIGAGVVSVVATAGGSVFQHFFHRTGEQLREVTVHHRPRARQVPHIGDGAPGTPRAPAPPVPHAPAARRRPTVGGADAHRAAGRATRPARAEVSGADAPRAPAVTSRRPATDLDRTRPLPPIDAARTQALTWADADRTRALPRVSADAVARAADRTRALPRVGPAARRPHHFGAEPGAGRAPDATEAGDPERGRGEDGAEFTGATTHGTRLRGGRRLAMAALGAFLLAMALITGIEWAAGGPMSNLWGDDRSGTTFSNSVSRHSETPTRPDPAPSVERPTPGADSDHGRHGDQDPHATPDASRPESDTSRPTRSPAAPPASTPPESGADPATPAPGAGDSSRPGTPSEPTPTGPATPGTGQESGSPPEGGSAEKQGGGTADAGQRPDRSTGLTGPDAPNAD